MTVRPKTWRERHPFLWGMSQTFGIFQPRRDVETVEETFDRTFDRIEAAIAEAERRQAQQ